MSYDNLCYKCQSLSLPLVRSSPLLVAVLTSYKLLENPNHIQGKVRGSWGERERKECVCV